MKLSFLVTDTGPETDYVIGTPPVVKLLYDVTVRYTYHYHYLSHMSDSACSFDIWKHLCILSYIYFK